MDAVGKAATPGAGVDAAGGWDEDLAGDPPMAARDNSLTGASGGGAGATESRASSAGELGMGWAERASVELR